MLRAFLGMVNYYRKFITNLSTLLQPLNMLLRPSKPWRWTAECDRAFRQAKEANSSTAVLAHYDPKLPLTLAGDASAYGIGAVISHILPDGSEEPIAFASRSLSTSERNYAQLEKEALSLIYAGVTNTCMARNFSWSQTTSLSWLYWGPRWVSLH